MDTSGLSSSKPSACYKNELNAIKKSGAQLQPVYEAFSNAWESIRDSMANSWLNRTATLDKIDKKKSRKSCDLQDSVRRERLSNLWFLRISQNTQIVVYQSFVKFAKNYNITEFLSVSLFLGVELGVDFEVTPKLRFAGYKFFITIGRCSWSLVLSQIYYNFGTKIHKTVLKKLNYCQSD